MSVTGDLKNNLRKLNLQLKKVKQDDCDLESISKGFASAYLPIYHFLFLEYSLPLASEIAARGIHMTAISDFKFIEAMYKVLRDIFNYKATINKAQFFQSGFAEIKIIMCTEIISLLKEYHFYKSKPALISKARKPIPKENEFDIKEVLSPSDSMQVLVTKHLDTLFAEPLRDEYFYAKGDSTMNCNAANNAILRRDDRRARFADEEFIVKQTVERYSPKPPGSPTPGHVRNTATTAPITEYGTANSAPSEPDAFNPYVGENREPRSCFKNGRPPDASFANHAPQPRKYGPPPRDVVPAQGGRAAAPPLRGLADDDANAYGHPRLSSDGANRPAYNYRGIQPSNDLDRTGFAVVAENPLLSPHDSLVHIREALRHQEHQHDLQRTRQHQLRRRDQPEPPRLASTFDPTWISQQSAADTPLEVDYAQQLQKQKDEIEDRSSANSNTNENLSECNDKESQSLHLSKKLDHYIKQQNNILNRLVQVEKKIDDLSKYENVTARLSILETKLVSMDSIQPINDNNNSSIDSTVRDEVKRDFVGVVSSIDEMIRDTNSLFANKDIIDSE